MNKIALFCIIIGIGCLGVLAISGTPKDSSVQSTSSVSDVVFPQATNYAVDMAGALSADELADLNAKLKAMDTPQHQFAVLVVKTTQPLSIEEYGIKLAESWKVGYKGLDNGAIIIIATEDRKVRIEVGYGLEGDIPDAIAGNIIADNMSASLKAGKWHDALVGGLTGLNNRIK